MWLKEIQEEFIDAFGKGQSLDKKEWADANIDRLNRQYVRALAVDGLTSALSKKIRSTKMEVGAIVSSQSELPFDLPFAVTIDPEGNRVKATHALTRDDMATALKLREKNVRDAQLKYSEWVAANRMAEPFWDKYPMWTFGQCVEAYMAPANDNADIKVAA